MTSIKAAGAYVTIDLQHRQADAALQGMLNAWRQKINQGFSRTGRGIGGGGVSFPFGGGGFGWGGGGIGREWGSRAWGNLRGPQFSGGLGLPGLSFSSLNAGASGSGNRSLFLGGGAGFAALGGAAGSVAFIRSLTKESRDYEETLNKFRLSFRELADETERWAEVSSVATRRAKVSFIGISSQFQNFFTGFGFGLKQSQEMSKALTRLSFDLGSFHNIADDEAARRLFQGLAGSTETLDIFGINAREARVREELKRNGVASYDQASGEQKVLARYNVILASTVNAQGDAVNTANSYANSLRGLTAASRQAAVALGMFFTRSSDLAKKTGRPEGVLAKILPDLTEITFRLGEYFEKNELAIRSDAKRIAALAQLYATYRLGLKVISPFAALTVSAAAGVAAMTSRVMALTSAMAGLARARAATGGVFSSLGNRRLASRVPISIRRRRSAAEAAVSSAASRRSRVVSRFNRFATRRARSRFGMAGVIGLNLASIGLNLASIVANATTAAARLGALAASFALVQKAALLFVAALGAIPVLGAAIHLTKIAGSSDLLRKSLESVGSAATKVTSIFSGIQSVADNLQKKTAEAISMFSEFSKEGEFGQAAASVGLSFAEGFIDAVKLIEKAINDMFERLKKKHPFIGGTIQGAFKAAETLDTALKVQRFRKADAILRKLEEPNEWENRIIDPRIEYQEASDALRPVVSGGDGWEGVNKAIEAAKKEREAQLVELRRRRGQRERDDAAFDWVADANYKAIDIAGASSEERGETEQEASARKARGNRVRFRVKSAITESLDADLVERRIAFARDRAAAFLADRSKQADPLGLSEALKRFATPSPKAVGLFSLFTGAEGRLGDIARDVEQSETVKQNLSGVFEKFKDFGKLLPDLTGNVIGGVVDAAKQLAQPSEKEKVVEADRWRSIATSFGSYSAAEALYGSLGNIDPLVRVQQQQFQEVRRLRELAERRKVVVL